MSVSRPWEASLPARGFAPKLFLADARSAHMSNFDSPLYGKVKSYSLSPHRVYSAEKLSELLLLRAI